ncbi:MULTISPECIES: hypothetical protein [unclassified Caulobacter]|uniref:hypothetical protein n=1 Tax=unclassified Caulobacter TaxID=2648921 RepID=UPI000B20FADC|nr:hypothetical protein [Caulobacter sp. UNC358MFTsu5.1]
MARASIRTSWLAWSVALLGALLLVAGPLAPAMAAPMDCCPDAPCRDIDKSACPQTCVVACQVIVAREHALSEPVRRDAPAIAPEPAAMPPGRALAPDLPPPR